MSTEDDKSILAAIRDGRNDSALQELYRHVLPRVKNFILRNSGDEEEAKDIFQDAVVALFRQIKSGKFDEKYEVGAFVFSVARNLWINRVKVKNRHTPMMDLEYDQTEEVPDVVDNMITDEKSKAIESLMNQIGKECKELLKYSVFDGISMKEICEKMGYSSENVAKTYNYRCKQKLVTLVKDNPQLIALLKG